MLVSRGRIHALAPHLERLAGSVAALYGARLPQGLCRRLTDEVAGIGGEQRLRVDFVPGAGVSMSTRTVGGGQRRPVTLEPLVVPGGLGPHKWRDRRLLQARPADPVPLLVDTDGTVLEAGWGNLWVLEDDRLVTPPADGRILPGVTRALLLGLAPSLGLTACEERVSLDRARDAAVTFATSAIRLAVAAGLAGRPAPPTAPVDRIRAALS